MGFPWISQEEGAALGRCLGLARWPLQLFNTRDGSGELGKMPRLGMPKLSRNAEHTRGSGARQREILQANTQREMRRSPPLSLPLNLPESECQNIPLTLFFGLQ